MVSINVYSRLSLTQDGDGGGGWFNHNIRRTQSLARLDYMIFQTAEVGNDGSKIRLATTHKNVDTHKEWEEKYLRHLNSRFKAISDQIMHTCQTQQDYWW